ncbi:hypothetical protein SY27_09440 [Flavobacterium sp. 316]|uniref:LPXTG-motif cell wall-anchored protein n=1 Tax=Flavobacterium sediminilitoris TaxID=2024526 RepID=A0ABY4HR33_9FLAO|nr:MULTISPECIES: hypothetical protein [Flavobacterium]KIX20993.1 hypothetical protein SY27_09440 [Flavobacterium sp. 316]UOX35338.1 hypothetical protein LXD69_07410 [Flavobacterium sediminilitoris]
MNYLKFIQYFYLAFGVFFLYDAFTKYQNNENYIMSIAIAVVAIGMFFFRRHFYNKHKNRQ